MASDEHEPMQRVEDGKGSGLGLVKGLGVTLKTMLRPAITQHYPHVKPDLPARTRGVIALKQENCTVCYKCSRECPDWCIYIDAHKETHEPAGGGQGRSVKVLDRFAIDFALCMYCGICVEVCPFDALFWSPEFEYAEYDIDELTHEKERLEDWTYRVLPPPELEEGAEPAPEDEPDAVASAAGGGDPRAAGVRVTAQEFAFVVLAFVGLVAAFRLVTTRNVVHGALFLVVTLASVGGIYLLLARRVRGLGAGAHLRRRDRGPVPVRPDADQGADRARDARQPAAAARARRRRSLVFGGLVFLCSTPSVVGSARERAPAPTSAAGIGDVAVP